MGLISYQMKVLTNPKAKNTEDLISDKEVLIMPSLLKVHYTYTKVTSFKPKTTSQTCTIRCQKMMDLSIYGNRILGIMGLCREFDIILGSCLRGCILWDWLGRVGWGWS